MTLRPGQGWQQDITAQVTAMEAKVAALEARIVELEKKPK